MSRSILVVDDDRSMVKTLCAVLRLHGWEPTPAYSGEEAVRVTASGQFAAVVMDVKMPGMNGVEAFRAIRAARSRAPVILMTAYAAHDLLAEAEREGVLSILSKPVSLDVLNQLLAGAARQRHSILVVDDDPAFLEALSEAIAARGHVVLRARSLEEALDLVAREAPAVVILDLPLGHAPPQDTVMAIRERDPNIVLILYSGHAMVLDEIVASLPPESIRAHLTKPFPFEQLVSLLG
jgi:DNA-binding NtrC family response regulator